jgi:hypothetical protein
VLYDLFDSDFNQIGGTMELTAPVEVEVTGISPIPEPRTWFFLGFGVAALIASDSVLKFGARFKRIKVASLKLVEK